MRADENHSLRQTPESCSCTSGPCGGGIARRELLRIVGLGAVSSVLAEPLRIMAGPFERGGDIQHFVPADKKLSAEWIRNLFAKGVPDKPVEQGFAVVAEVDGRRAIRRLSIAEFPQVSFRGEYPIGIVDYAHPDCPVRVRMEAFSPFIPLNAKDSGLPATIMRLTLTNTTDKPVRTNVLGWLENAAGCHSADFFDEAGRRESRITERNGRAMIVHTVEELPTLNKPTPRSPIVLADFEGENYGDWQATGEAFGNGPAKGTFPGQNPVSGFEGKGLANSWKGNDDLEGTLTSPSFEVTRKFLNFKVGGGGHPKEACLNLVIDGKVVLSETGSNSEELRWRSWSVRRFAGKQARIEIVDRRKGGWGHINVDQIELSDESRLAPTGSLALQGDFGSMTLATLSPAHAGGFPHCIHGG